MASVRTVLLDGKAADREMIDRLYTKKMNVLFPKVSVVIPVYNAACYLPTSLKSVCGQTLSDIEIILIDDGSTDGSGLLADQIAEKDERIRVFHQPNAHIRATRDAGLLYARGQYVVFVDSDDWIEPDMLLSMYEAAESNALDLVIMGRIIEYTKEKRAESLHVNQYMEASDIASVWQLYLTLKETKLVDIVTNKLYRTSVYRDHELHFQVEAPFEDESFNLEFFMCSRKIGVLCETFYHYMRNDEASIVSSYKKDFLESYQKKVAIYKRFFTYFKVDKEWTNRFMSEIDFSTYCLYLQSLYKQNARLNRKRRVAVIRRCIYQDSAVMQTVRERAGKNVYEKIFRELILHTSPSVADRVYSVLFFLRLHCESFYHYFRKQAI